MLATAATVQSHAYRAACEAVGLRATEVACPLLVPLVEEGWTDHQVTREVLRIYLSEALAKSEPHAVLLGCTHYPLIAGAIEATLRELGSDAVVIDSAEATAEAAGAALGARVEPNETETSVTFECYATDSVEKFQRLGSLFLRQPIAQVHTSTWADRLVGTMHYLLKSEPDKYSYDDLLRDGETTWDGIKNPQALITLRNMKRGEKCVIYHSNVGKAAVGTAKVVSVTTDPADPKMPIVRLKAGKRLKREKPLAEIRDAGVFQGSMLFRQFRLSVVPLTRGAVRLAGSRLRRGVRSQSSPQTVILSLG